MSYSASATYSGDKRFKLSFALPSGVESYTADDYCYAGLAPRLSNKIYLRDYEGFLTRLLLVSCNVSLSFSAAMLANAVDSAAFVPVGTAVPNISSSAYAISSSDS